MRWLDRFPLWLLVALSAWMAVAPINPEPHLAEKLRMLSHGTLTRAVDIFDLCYHLAPSALLVIKVWRVIKARGTHRAGQTQSPESAQ